MRRGTRFEWGPADERDHGQDTDDQASRHPRGDLLAHEPDGDGCREQRRRGVEERGEPGRQRDGRDRDEGERHGREQGPDDQEGRHPTACDPKRRRAGDGQQDRRPDGEADLGCPGRPDLGRGDAKEEERRAPDRAEEDQRAEVDDREWAPGRRRDGVPCRHRGATTQRSPIDAGRETHRHSTALRCGRARHDETPPSDGVSVRSGVVRVSCRRPPPTVAAVSAS